MAVSLNIPTRARAQQPQAEGEERPRAEFYVNVGYWDVINGEDVFVSLPMGIGLDTMKDVEVRGNNEGYIELCRRKNALRKLLLDGAMGFDPGEADDVQELVVQIRRDKPRQTNTSNPTGETTLTKLTFGRRA